MWSNYLSDYFPLFFFFIASPLSLLNLHHPSPYLHSPKPSYRSTHFSCPAPAHLFHHLPLFIFPQESQTLLVLSLSLSLHSLSISLWYFMPLTRGVRCGRCSGWFSDLARFRGGFRSLCFRGRDSGWVFVFVAWFCPREFGMILDGGIRLQDGFCGVDVVGLVWFCGYGFWG